jgi:hypothetical protein
MRMMLLKRCNSVSKSILNIINNNVHSYSTSIVIRNNNKDIHITSSNITSTIKIDNNTKPKTNEKISKCSTNDNDDDELDEMEEMFVMGPKGMEWNGPTRGGQRPEPTRYGDWERKGRASDF